MFTYLARTAQSTFPVSVIKTNELRTGKYCNLCSSCVPHKRKCLVLAEVEFLGAYANLRKATINFVMSVRLLSVRIELGSHRTDFQTFDIRGFLESLSRKIKFH